MQQQRRILTQKNEIEQTALAVMAQCKALSNQLESAGDSQDYVLQLCLDQLDSDDILEHNDQFVVQNAYLFNNHYVLKTVRKELLTNPCGRL